jgi:hypothetical protein
VQPIAAWAKFTAYWAAGKRNLGLALTESRDSGTLPPRRVSRSHDGVAVTPSAQQRRCFRLAARIQKTWSGRCRFRSCGLT